MKERIELANKELEKVVSFLTENRDAFDYMDLKLHDVNDYYYSDNLKNDFPLCAKENYDYFSDFCDLEYLFFKENLKENFNINFEDMIHPLYHTSKFYLHDTYVIDVNNIDLTLFSLINCFTNISEEEFIFKDSKIVLNNTINNGIKDKIEYIISDFYDDVENYCEDIITVSDIIKDFKDSQIDYFKGYMADEEYELEIDNHYNICLSIKNKYNINDDDMETLKLYLKDFY